MRTEYTVQLTYDFVDAKGTGSGRELIQTRKQRMTLLELKNIEQSVRERRGFKSMVITGYQYM